MAKYLERLAARAQATAPVQPVVTISPQGRLDDTTSFDDPFESAETGDAVVTPAVEEQSDSQQLSRQDVSDQEVSPSVLRREDRQQPVEDPVPGEPRFTPSASSDIAAVSDTETGAADVPVTTDVQYIGDVGQNDPAGAISVAPGLANDGHPEHVEFAASRPFDVQNLVSNLSRVAERGHDIQQNDLPGARPRSIDDSSSRQGRGHAQSLDADPVTGYVADLLMPLAADAREQPSFRSEQATGDDTKLSIGSITVELTSPPQEPAPEAPRRRSPRRSRGVSRPTAARSRNSFGLGQV